MSRLTKARFERLRREIGGVCEVGDAIGASCGAYSNWECGQKGRKLPKKAVEKLAALLGVAAREIAEEDGSAVFVL